MDQKIVKTYLVYGDSGVGKSSFIRSLNGRSDAGELPAIGGRGDSCTQTPGQVYFVKDHPVLGDVQLIDTRGTWDPSAVDNSQILNDLIKTLLDYSTDGMKKNLNPIQTIDGVIYVHTSLSYDRYSRDIRIAHLQTLIGCDLIHSTITLMTHVSSIQKLDKEYCTFKEMVAYKHSSEKQYQYWDSERPLQNQCEQLKEKLLNLKPFTLTRLEQANEQIIQLARELQVEDKVETQVTKYVPVMVEKNVFTTIEIDADKEITLQIKCPDYYGRRFISNLTNRVDNIYATRYQQNYQVEPFPTNALPPRQIKSIEIKAQDLQNAEFMQAPELNNLGDRYEIVLHYKWRAVQDDTSPGKIYLRIVAKLQYKKEISVQVQESKEEVTMELLPRYPDEKPYLMQAQEKLLSQIVFGFTNSNLHN